MRDVVVALKISRESFNLAIGDLSIFYLSDLSKNAYIQTRTSLPCELLGQHELAVTQAYQRLDRNKSSSA